MRAKSRLGGRVLLAGALLACVWTSGARLNACGCGRSDLPCEATWEATAVFVGQLASTVDEAPDPKRDAMAWPSDPSRRFTFKVVEAFRGVSALQVSIYGERNSSCALALTQGETYLVYAFPLGESRLYTHYCSRTRRVAEAAEDLDYLRGPAKQPAGLGTIQGVARQPDLQPKNGFHFDDEPPFAGGRVRVEAIDPNRPATYEGSTGRDGRYAVRVPVGQYRIAMTVRDGLWVAGPHPSLPLEVRDPRGCASADFIVYPDGRLGGRLRDAEGRPVPAMAIEAIPADDLAKEMYVSDRTVRTDEAGAFEFTRLKPGDYVVGLTISRFDRTGERTVWLEREGEPVRSRFPLAAEQRLWIGELELPKSLEVTTVTGVVLDAGGRVARDARVRVLEGDYDHEPGMTPVGTDGSFMFSLVAGRTYRLIAERLSDSGTTRVQAKTEPFKALAGRMSFALRFEK